MSKKDRLITRLFGNLTPEQGTALGWSLVAIGAALIIKAVLDMWPGIASTIIRGALFAVVVVMGYRSVGAIHTLEGYKPWFIPIAAGGGLNWLAAIANGGYMPTAVQASPGGLYIPMEGSNLPYLGDWIFGFISPGDVILFVAFAGLIFTMVGNRKGKVNQEA